MRLGDITGLGCMDWVISLANEWEDYSNYLGKGRGFPGIGPPPPFWTFMVGFKTVMALVAESFS